MAEYIFTFGYGQPNAGKCVRIQGEWEEARQKMVDKYGTEWAFQYPAEKWDAWKKDPEKPPYILLALHIGLFASNSPMSATLKKLTPLTGLEPAWPYAY